MRAWITILVLLWALPGWAQDEPAAGPDPTVAALDAATRANELASRGRYADAVPYYQKAIRLDGRNHELAYFNLAEVQKARGNCRAAVLMFQLYASMVASPEARAEANAAMKGCPVEKWPTLELKVEPSHAGEILIDGVLAAPGGTFGPLRVPPGSYEVTFQAADHHPELETIEVKAEPVSVTRTLKKMTFFGTIVVNVDTEGAQVRIFEGPSDETKELFKGLVPMKKPVKAREGRHFVEVTCDGYDRWIRNVSVGRDLESVVDVTLRRSLPPEIQ